MIKIISTEAKIRLDKYLAQILVNYGLSWSRSHIVHAIKDLQVTVNNKNVQPSHILNIGDTIKVDGSYTGPQQTLLDSKIKPEEMDLDIIYEDDDLMVVNKPNHMVVHPSIGHTTNTLLHGLKYHSKKLSDFHADPLRPGVVHRIDKDTTGLLIVAKNNKAHQKIAVDLRDHKIQRSYLAICHGLIKEPAGRIEAPLGRDPNNRLKIKVQATKSKQAITNFIVISRSKDYTYIKCSLETGRTHQIRSHLCYIQHPILGDHLYGWKEDKHIAFGQFLHAYKLSFYHPITNQLMVFKAPIPDEFQSKLKLLDLD